MEILAASLTPLIAVIAVYIACQQYLANKMKLKHDAYDRRLAVYRRVIKFLSGILTTGKVSQEELLSFTWETNERYFLFDDEIPEYIQAIYDHGNELLYTTNRMEADLTPEERGRIAGRNAEALKWLVDQLPVVKTKFMKYLKIDI